MQLYSHITDPLDAINKLGMAFYKSGMFGCGNIEQGQILAMTCLTEGLTPLEFQRRYHIISGRPSLRADYMLAEFTKQGGEYKVIERTSETATIELNIGKRKSVFSFTIAEAMGEEYVYNKLGNEGKIPKVGPDGKINDKACKDNWSTPRRRAQMLWNRVVSDAIRTICPTVNHGGYTPDELGGDEIEHETEGPPVQVATAKTEDASPLKGDPLGEPIDAEFVVVKDEPKNEQPAEQPVEEKPAEPPFRTEPMYDRDGLLVRLKTAKEALGLSPEQYRGILAKRGATSAKDLADPELASLVNACETKLETLRKQREAANHVDQTLGK
jgi:hypothetical protein